MMPTRLYVWRSNDYLELPFPSVYAAMCAALIITIQSHDLTPEKIVDFEGKEFYTPDMFSYWDEHDIHNDDEVRSALFAS